MPADLLYPDWKVKSTHPEMTYAGTWVTDQTDNSGHNTGDKFATSTAAGAKCTITSEVPFTDAVLFMYGGRDAGLAEIRVDGKVYATQDCFLYLDGSANAMKNVPMVWLTDLPKGNHVVEIINKGVKGNDNSTGTVVGINWMTILDADHPAGQPFKSTHLWVGDSNSDSSSAWCDKHFKRLLNNFWPGNRVQHAYCTRPSGSTDVLRFFENMIIAYRPEMITMMLGTNDLPADAKYNLNTKAAIESAIQIAKRYGVEIQLCTILPRNGLNAYSWNKVNGQIKELAAFYSLYYLDINEYVTGNVASTTTPINSDGIHMDQVGHGLAAHHAFEQMVRIGHPFHKLLK